MNSVGLGHQVFCQGLLEHRDNLRLRAETTRIKRFTTRPREDERPKLLTTYPPYAIIYFRQTRVLPRSVYDKKKSLPAKVAVNQGQVVDELHKVVGELLHVIAVLHLQNFSFCKTSEKCS